MRAGTNLQELEDRMNESWQVVRRPSCEFPLGSTWMLVVIVIISKRDKKGTSRNERVRELGKRLLILVTKCDCVRPMSG